MHRVRLAQVMSKSATMDHIASACQSMTVLWRASPPLDLTRTSSIHSQPVSKMASVSYSQNASALAAHFTDSL
jgi:hypothetical protein